MNTLTFLYHYHLRILHDKGFCILTWVFKESGERTLFNKSDPRDVKTFKWIVLFESGET